MPECGGKAEGAALVPVRHETPGRLHGAGMDRHPTATRHVAIHAWPRITRGRRRSRPREGDLPVMRVGRSGAREQGAEARFRERRGIDSKPFVSRRGCVLPRARLRSGQSTTAGSPCSSSMCWARVWSAGSRCQRGSTSGVRLKPSCSSGWRWLRSERVNER